VTRLGVAALLIAPIVFGIAGAPRSAAAALAATMSTVEEYEARSSTGARALGEFITLVATLSPNADVDPAQLGRLQASRDQFEATVTWLMACRPPVAVLGRHVQTLPLQQETLAAMSAVVETLRRSDRPGFTVAQEQLSSALRRFATTLNKFVPRAP